MDIEEYSKYKQFYDENIPELLEKYLNQNKWETYLDLGCGDGSLLYALNKKGCFKNKKVFAVDLSENRINLAKKINKNFICHVNDACDIKNIQSESIDFLVSTQLIEHVPSDEQMVKEISRVMKKNSVIYISTVFKKWYGWYFYKCNGKWALDPTHLREYSKDSQLFNILIENGFEILENKKILAKHPLINFFIRRMGFEFYTKDNYFIHFLRLLKVPILGYYKWDIICKKK